MKRRLPPESINADAGDITTHRAADPTDLDDASAAENHEFALRRASRYITQLYERSLVPVGLTPPQFTILRHLAGRDPMTMLEISRTVMIERTAMLRAMRVLQKDGLVLSQSLPGSRTLLLSLSESGKARTEQARALWRVGQREFEARYGVARAARLRQELFGIKAQLPDGETQQHTHEEEKPVDDRGGMLGD